MGKRKDGCQGCGRVDPCGEHYEDCTLLEPGDNLVTAIREAIVMLGSGGGGHAWDYNSLGGIHKRSYTIADLLQRAVEPIADA